MIFGTPIGATAAPTSVGRVQGLMQLISNLLAKPDYAPGRTDGTIVFQTAYGLLMLSKDGVAQIPYVSDVVGAVWDVIDAIPVGSTKKKLQVLWETDARIPGTDFKFRTDIQKLIQKGADQTEGLLSKVVGDVRPEGSFTRFQTRNPMTAVTTLETTAAPDQMPTAIPVGTVAVHDPETGKYYLVAPPAPSIPG